MAFTVSQATMNEAYLSALYSIDFIACNTIAEFNRVWFNGSNLARAIPMPRVETWYEAHYKRTPAIGRERTIKFMCDLIEDIRQSRERARGVCVDCGAKSCPGGHRRERRLGYDVRNDDWLA